MKTSQIGNARRGSARSSGSPTSRAAMASKDSLDLRSNSDSRAIWFYPHHRPRVSIQSLAQENQGPRGGYPPAGGLVGHVGVNDGGPETCPCPGGRLKASNQTA